MDAQRWLRELRAELARRKLPPLYVERFVSELSDHITDFVEDRMSTDAKDLQGAFHRLGSPDQVAASAVKEYRQTRFSRRHPVLMFVALPILALPLLWTGGIFCLVILVKVLGLEFGKADPGSPLWRWAEASIPYVVVSFLVIPVALAALLFCRLAQRATVGWKWSLAACVLLAFLGGLAMAQVTLPTATTQGSFSLGLGLSAQPSASQCLQFLVPMSIGGFAAWRQVRRQTRELAS